MGFQLRIKSIVICLLLLSIVSVINFVVLKPIYATPTQKELEEWFKSDELDPPSKSSDSQLKFIPPVSTPTLHSINTINILNSSISNGWVGLAQCYKHLDAVPDMEVTYQYKNMRKLTIKSTQNIERAFIRGNSVQLDNVGKNASLCIQAEVQILYKNIDGTFRLVNGPFHRQFLDSFFPYHLTMNIHYPVSQLEVVSHKPQQQTSFIVNQNPGVISFDTFFTGKLYTEFTFKEKSK